MENGGSAYLTTRSPAYPVGGQQEDFSCEKRAVAGENYERSVVFWKPSKREVIGHHVTLLNRFQNHVYTSKRGRISNIE